MCPISAKPVTTAKIAMITPERAVLRQAQIGSNLRSFCGWAWVAYVARCFLFQRGIEVCDLRKHVKIQAGGGERVAHSRVRPFHGSAGSPSAFTVADRDHNDQLADNPRENDDDADRRNHQPRFQAGDVVMLPAAGHCP